MGSTIITGEELQNFLKLMFTPSMDWERDDIALAEMIINAVVKDGKFDCNEWEIVEGKMAYPITAVKKRRLRGDVHVITWGEIPFVLKKVVSDG